jgi:hypothetical protein
MAAKRLNGSRSRPFSGELAGSRPVPGRDPVVSLFEAR